MSPASDVRSGGQWTPEQRRKNAVLYVVIRVALAVADRVPARTLAALGRIAGQLAYAASGALRRRTVAAVQAALGTHDAESIARRSFAVAGESLALCLLLRRPGFRALDRVTLAPGSRKALASAMATGRGVVFVSAHLGPFELVAAAVAELGVDVAVITRESYDPRLDPVVDRHRLDRGVEVIHRGQPGASLRAARALRRGAVVGILPDLASRLGGPPVPMLRGTAEIPDGAARLARATGAAVVVGALRPHDGRYRLVIRRVGATCKDAGAATGAHLMRRVMVELGGHIEAWPEGWLWPASPVTAAGPIARRSP